MRLSRDKGRRAATGADLVRALAGLGMSVGPASARIPRPGPEERDDTGALPAGHPVSWQALWKEEIAPDYRRVAFRSG